MEYDEDGQPRTLGFNVARRRARDISEMLGIAKGLIADGIINADEAKYLHDWGQSHPDALSTFPANLLFTRLNQFFADGRVDDEEREELREILSGLVGGTIGLSLGYEASTTYPLDQPPPLICWQKEVYVFTGRFAYGTRKQCEREILQRGGTVEDNVTRRTTFLVIGTFSSPDWEQSNYGRKIQRAVELRQSALPLRIVAEDHWSNALSVAV